jgi:hypothetical protein
MDKYLKYKQKYLNLKKIIGGSGTTQPVMTVEKYLKELSKIFDPKYIEERLLPYIPDDKKQRLYDQKNTEKIRTYINTLSEMLQNAKREEQQQKTRPTQVNATEQRDKVTRTIPIMNKIIRKLNSHLNKLAQVISVLEDIELYKFEDIEMTISQISDYALVRLSPFQRAKPVESKYSVLRDSRYTEYNIINKEQADADEQGSGIPSSTLLRVGNNLYFAQMTSRAFRSWLDVVSDKLEMKPVTPRENGIVTLCDNFTDTRNVLERYTIVYKSIRADGKIDMEYDVLKIIRDHLYKHGHYMLRDDLYPQQYFERPKRITHFPRMEQKSMIDRDENLSYIYKIGIFIATLISKPNMFPNSTSMACTACTAEDINPLYNSLIVVDRKHFKEAVDQKRQLSPEEERNKIIRCQKGHEICLKCTKSLSQHLRGRVCPDTLSKDEEEVLKSGVMLLTCPNCGYKRQKDNGCNHITCPDCESHYCDICNTIFGDRRTPKRTIDAKKEAHYRPGGGTECSGRLHDQAELDRLRDNQQRERDQAAAEHREVRLNADDRAIFEIDWDAQDNQ